jgi:signal transduction histidine kinase
MAAERRVGRFSTIRARTTVAATVVVAAALVLGGVLTLLVLRRELVESVDEAATRRAQDVAELVSQNSLPRSLSAAGEEAAIVQVVDDRGDVLAATNNLAGRGPVLRRRPVHDVEVHTVTGLPVPDERDDHFRVVTLVVNAQSGPVTVSAAESLEGVNNAVDAVSRALLIGFPFMLLVVALTTWYVVGRALRPVEAIRREVDDISASDLSRRVPQPPTNDEIGRLAETMNRMLDRLESFSERQRRFVADASHELQSPLASSMADLELAMAHPEVAAWQETAAGVAADAQRMTKLVQDLLFLAQSDDKGARAPQTLVDLDDIVRAEVSRLSGHNGHGLVVDTAGVQPAEVRGDADQLGRVLRNLLDNASRYARSRIAVSLGADGDTVRMVVADDGPGVPVDLQDRMFERFTRADDSRSRDTGGTGLGLAIAREIVERHGGSICLEANGVGARFVVSMPAPAPAGN